MNSFKVSLTLLVLCFSFYASAKEVTDTLYSAKNDRVIVTYSITQKGNSVDLQFKSIRKMLGDEHRKKYKGTDKVQTFFFDWIGARKDMEFKGITPSCIVLPAKASYKNSSDGYFIVEQQPSISFEMEPTGATSFTVPLYLAHYEGKQRYNIFCACGNLEIPLPKPTTPLTETRTASKKPTQQSREEFIEVDGEEISEFDDEALNYINSIMNSLPHQVTIPMEKTLEMEVENLIKIKAKVKKDDVAKRIDETINAYNSKRRELEMAIAESNKEKADDDAFNNCSTKENYERYVKQNPNGKHVEEAKEEIGKLEAKAKEEEASKKKRTIWMIIGGALLAILLFVGNQVMQSFRNKRTQRSMMQMQQDATKRAQSMARSKAQGEIRKQTNNAKGQVRKKGQTIIRGSADKAKNNKGNKRLSI